MSKQTESTAQLKAIGYRCRTVTWGACGHNVTQYHVARPDGEVVTGDFLSAADAWSSACARFRGVLPVTSE